MPHRAAAATSNHQLEPMQPLKSHIKFLLRKHLTIDRRAPTPHIEQELVEFFQSRSNKTLKVLESGAGGSTLFLQKMFEVKSLETDLKYCRKINAAAKGSPVSHIDVGLTGRWGFPIFNPLMHLESIRSIERSFRVEEPDIVFIDGRFRVAMFLMTLQYSIASGKAVTVIFDDYRDREYYKVAEEFVKIRKQIGRAAVFEVEPSEVENRRMLESILLLAQSDSR